MQNLPYPRVLPTHHTRMEIVGSDRPGHKLTLADPVPEFQTASL